VLPTEPRAKTPAGGAFGGGAGTGDQAAACIPRPGVTDSVRLYSLVNFAVGTAAAAEAGSHRGLLQTTCDPRSLAVMRRRRPPAEQGGRRNRP
jgi:hypothetical protein